MVELKAEMMVGYEEWMMAQSMALRLVEVMAWMRVG
jgi:hypothetical protein